MLSCPRCRRTQLARIVYGPRHGTSPGIEVVRGGNVIRPDSPGWRCLACGAEYGSAYESVRPLDLRRL